MGPLKRTPPPASAAPAAPTAPAAPAANTSLVECRPAGAGKAKASLMQSYDSDTSEKSAASGCKYNVRHKRKREHDEFLEMRNEMRGLFSQLTTAVDARFSEIKEITTELQSSIQFMSDQYDGVMNKLHELESERKKDHTYISQLEDKVEDLERKARMSGIEIRNIPKADAGDGRKTENKNQLVDIVKKVAKSVQLDLQDVDIRDTYRINSVKGDLKPIIVDFNSVSKKEQLLDAVKNFNKTKPKGQKLNTGHLEIAGPARPVYISETLTPKNQRLFFMAREFARDNNYEHRWTSKGLVYMRKAEGHKPVRIDHEADFLKLQNPN